MSSSLKKNEKEKPKKIDKDWAFDFLISEFKKETDRAAVILVAAILDEKLTTLLKSRLIAIPSANDDLFEGGNAPISTFSSKIDVSFRLGLISSRFCRDLHLVRKIRNSFAHDIYGCSFENGGVKARVMELGKTCTTLPYYEVLVEEDNAKIEHGSRGVFLFVVSLMVMTLDSLLDSIVSIEPVEAISSEFMYQDGPSYAKDRRESRKKEKEEEKE